MTDEPDETDWLFERARELHEDRYGRIGSCRVCGEPVLWWNTEWKTRVPLDPVPLLDLADAAGPGQLYIPKGKTAVFKINPEITGEIFVYKLHNDGECLRVARGAEQES